MNYPCSDWNWILWKENRFVKSGNLFVKMDKICRSQLPDSSSSPPLRYFVQKTFEKNYLTNESDVSNSAMNFHSFEDDLISDLPSCVYANHQLNSTPNTGNLRLNSNSLRQIQQQYLHHSGKFYDYFLDLFKWSHT